MYSPLTAEEKNQILHLWEEGLSALKISKQVNRASNSVKNFLQREGIYETRYCGVKNLKLTEIQESEVCVLYTRGVSPKELSTTYNIHETSILNTLRRGGVNLRTRKESLALLDRSGSNGGNWKGGRNQRLNGYVQIYIPKNDPLHCMVHKGGCYAFEHRIVVARSIGRPLNSNETVHHINGDKIDNRIENLQLRFGNHGPGRVLCCEDCGSVNIIEKVI